MAMIVSTVTVIRVADDAREHDIGTHTAAMMPSVDGSIRFSLHPVHVLAENAVRQKTASPQHGEDRGALQFQWQEECRNLLHEADDEAAPECAEDRPQAPSTTAAHAVMRTDAHMRLNG